MTSEVVVNDPGSFWDGAPIIASYTRAQAIADGVLIDLMAEEFGGMVLDAGFRHPIAMTAAAFAKCTAMTDAARPSRYSVENRLWDVLMAARAPMRGSTAQARVVSFAWWCLHEEGEPERVNLKIVCGPGDDGEHVLTIMLAE